MEIYSDYLPEIKDISSLHNYIALETLLRALEDDISIISSGSEGHIDLRSCGEIESLQALHELVAMSCFELDMICTLHPNGEQRIYHTPYGREIRRGWQTNHHKVKTSKGWVVFDVFVDTNIHGPLFH